MLQELADFGDDVLLVDDDQAPVLPSAAAVERAIAPLRRVVTWLLAGGEDRGRTLRFLEAIAAIQVAPLRGLDLGPELAAAVRKLVLPLRGISELPYREQRAALEEMVAELGRMDAMLGTRAPARSPARRGRGAPSRGRRAPQAPRKSPRVARAAAPVARPSPAAKAPPPPEPEPEPQDEDGLQLYAFEAAFEELPEDLRLPLVEAGLAQVWDILLAPPVDEEVLRPLYGAGRVTEAGRVAISGRVRGRATRCTPTGEQFPEVLVVGAGPVWLRWGSEGHPSWLRDSLIPDARVIVVGDYSDEGAPILRAPELAVADGRNAVRLARYGLAAPDRLIREALRVLVPSLEGGGDYLNAEELAHLKLMGLGVALREVHSRGPERHEAHRRLAFDEALRLQVGLGWMGLGVVRERGISHVMAHGPTALLSLQSEMVLSDAQQSALESIKRDLRAPLPMQRVLTGEVGAGKSLIALWTEIMVASSRSQVVVVHEDEAAAEHAYLFAEPLLKELGLVGRVLLGSPTKAQRDALKRGEVHVIYGTLALLSEGLEFRRLGLVVAHEAAAFGVPEALTRGYKPPKPDLLVVTATPLPVQILLTAFARFDVSVLDRVGGQPVTARLIRAEDRLEAYREALQFLGRGHQVIVAFPMLEGRDVLDPREALRAVEAIENEFQGYIVGLFHGGMSRDERGRVYEAFRHRRLDVLVSTTHFEGGPVVPDATVILVEHAEVFGHARLQRVRAQAALGRRPGHCLFVVGPEVQEDALNWLGALVEHDDGYKLSELHMRQFGLPRLHGGAVVVEPTFRWVRAVEDREVVLKARHAGHQLMQAGAAARRAEWAEFLNLTRLRWGDFFAETCPIPPQGSGNTKRRRRRRRR